MPVQKQYSNTQAIEIKTVLDTVELEPGLFIFRRTLSSSEKVYEGKNTLKANKEDLPHKEESGFTNKKGIAELIKGKSVSKNNVKNLTWLSADDLELFRTQGYQNATEIIYNRKGKKWPSAWEQWEANKGNSLDNIVALNGHAHLLNDRHGAPLPVALVFDYISGNVDNGNYNLEEAFQQLVQNPSVRVFKRRINSRHFTPEDFTENFDDAVFYIPHYNREENCDKALQFLWTPDRETYLEVFQNAEKESMRHQLVLESDVLGLKALRMHHNDRKRLGL